LSASQDMAGAIGAFYAAATGDGTWDSALDRLLDVTGFAGAVLWTLRDITAMSEGRSIWHRFDPSIKPDYVNHYVTIDPNMKFVAAPDKYRLIYDHMVLPEEELDRNEYYAWYQARSGMRYHIGGVSRPGLDFFASVTVHRQGRLGHATEAELERFQLLFDHMERALEVEHRLNLDRGVVDALGRLAMPDAAGCVFFDRGGRTVFVNQAARDIAARDDGFVLTATGAAAARSAEDSRLQTLIAECIATATDDGLSRGGALRLPRKNGGRDYVITVAPMHERGDGPFSHLCPAACLLIVDPDQDRAVDAAMIRRLYGMSPAGAGLAARLAAGETLREAARARGITVGTARSYLEEIFHRTATSRQVDLVRLLLTLPRG
jgi:DNA-binding CsgD family transcriptional regulator